MRRKRLVCLIVAAAMLSTSLTACSSGKTQKTGGETAKTESVEGKAPTKATEPETEEEKEGLAEFSNGSKSMVLMAPEEWQSIDSGMDDMLMVGNKKGDIAMMVQRISKDTNIDEAQEEELLNTLSANMGESLGGATGTVLEEDTLNIDGLNWLRSEEFDAPISGFPSKHYAAYFKNEDAYYFIRFTTTKDQYDKELENVKGYLETLAIGEASLQIGEADPDLSDTIRWFNTVTSVYMTSAGFDVNKFGGLAEGTTGEAMAAGLLGQSWGVLDKESAKEVLDDLLTGYSNVAAQDLYKTLLLEEFESEEELETVLRSEDFSQEEINYCKAVFNAVNQLGDKGILGWDYCRGMYVAAWTYLAGYYTYEEALDVCMEFAEKIQSDFSSWDEFMESYLYGFQYWNEDDRADTSSESYKRAQIYEELKDVANSPFQIDFNMALEKDW